MAQGREIIKRSRRSAVRSHAARKIAVLGYGAVACAVVIGASACGGSGGSGGNSNAQGGGSYCAGKTVTFISPDAPGAQDDTIMRAAAAGMGKVLNCTTKVTNVPQGSTIPGQDEAAGAAPDGLTIGYLNIASDLDAKSAGTPGVNFSETGVGFIGSPPAPYNVLVSTPSSPYTTIQNLIQSSQNVPILTEASGGASSTLKALIAAYGIKASLVTGYANSADLVQGFIRGDGPVTDTAENPLLTAIQSGQARPILQLGSADTSSKLASMLKNVPTLADLQKELPPSTADGQKLLTALTAYRSLPQQWLFVPAGTPASILTQLRKAMQATFTDAATEKSLSAQGLAAGYVPGTQGKQDVTAMAVAVPELTKYINKSKKS
jgi:tripartite-type tricarboxylate transporter receptor subunit TctC